MLPVLAPVKTGPKKAVPGAEQLVNRIRKNKNKNFLNINYSADI